MSQNDTSGVNKADNESLQNENSTSGLKHVLLSPLGKSLALHGLIAASLLMSFNFSAKPLKFVEQSSQAASVQPEIVKATFIDSNVLEQKRREKAQSEADAKRKRMERERQEKRRQEELRKKRVEEARKKEAAQQEQERLNKLEEEQRKEREIAKRLEQEAKEKAEQQRQFEQQLEDELAAEQQAMSKVNERRIMSEVEKYKALVYSKVKRNLDTDGGFIGKSCKINVRLANDGLVLQAKAIAGDSALCRLAQSAVLKAGTLPVSKDPDVMKQFKNFDIEVRPEK